MTLISREEVLSTLKQVFDKYNIGFGGCSGGFAEAVPKAVENIPAIYDMQDKWIPSEVPPNNNEYVLLSFANFSVPLVGRYEEDEEGGAYYVGDDDKSCVSQYIIVNAWQPLPEQYKE